MIQIIKYFNNLLNINKMQQKYKIKLKQQCKQRIQISEQINFKGLQKITMNQLEKQYFIKFKFKTHLRERILRRETLNHQKCNSLYSQALQNKITNFHESHMSSFKIRNNKNSYQGINNNEQQSSQSILDHSTKLKSIKSYFSVIQISLIIFLSLIFTASSAANSAISCTNYVSNQYTDCTIELFDFTTFIPKDSYVLIYFPKQYQAVTLHDNQPYSGYDTVNVNFCPADCTAVSITYSAYVFMLKNMFPNDVNGILFTYTIFNIKNPSLQTITNDFLIQIRDSTLMNVLFTQSQTGFSIAAQPFQSLTATLDYPYLWSISQVTFTMLITNQVDYVQLAFPTKWQNQTRVLSNSLTDTVLVNSPTHQVNSSKVFSNIRVDFPIVLNSSQTLTLVLKSIYTPSSMMELGPITITAYNYNNKIIRKTIFYIPSSQLSYDQIRITEAYVVYDLINNKVFIRNRFKLPRDTIRNDKYSITYPNQLTISSNASDYQVYVANSLVASVPTFLGNNTIEISPINSTDFQTDIQVVMKINWPKAIVLTGNFIIQSFRKISTGFSKMEEANCCALWIKEKPTLIASLTLQNNQRLRANVQYRFNFTHKFATLSPTDSLVLLFPANYQLDLSKNSSVCASVIFNLASNSSNLNAFFSCNLNNNTLVLSNIFVSNQNPALLQLKLNISNPPNPPTDTFQIWSQDVLGAKIESNSLITVSVDPATLSSVMTFPSSNITNSKSNYVFDIISIGTVLKNYIIRVTIPEQIGVMIYSITCQINFIQQLCRYNKSTREITVLNSIDLASTAFSLKINNLINPQTLRTTSNFKIQIYDASNNFIQSSQSLLLGLTVQMNQLDTFLYSRMQFNESSLDSKGILKFLLVANNNLNAGQTYKIDLSLSQSTFLMLNQSISILSIQNTAKNYSLSNISSILSISFNFTPSSSKNIIQFSFSEIYIFSDKLSFNSTLSKFINSTYYKSAQTVSEVRLQYGLNSILISDYQITQNSYFMNQSPGIITLTINSISTNITFSYMIIYVPKNYQTSSGTYTFNSTSNSTIVSFNISDLLNPIQIQKDFFTFILYDTNNQIVGVSKPSNQYFQTQCSYPCRNCKSITQPALCSDCYQIITNPVTHIQTQPSYGMCTDYCISGEYLNLTVKKCLYCDSNCSSCIISINGSSGDPNICLTCQTGKYLYNSRCYTTCPNGYYSNNLICSQCIPNCALCSGLNSCSQCNQGFLFYQGLCILSCPLQTIQSLIPLSLTLYQCLSCSDINCLKCSNINTCILCREGKYLYNNLCLPACPIVATQQYYPNLNRVCSPCQCQTCANWSYNCTSCTSALLFDSAKFACLIKCEDGQYNSSGVCQKCPNQCLTCLNYNYCTICKETYALYRNITSFTISCTSQCPNITLLTIQTINSTSHIVQCIACTLGCRTCLISPSFCLDCLTGYLFLNNKCLVNCPLGYHNISNICQQCNTKCLSCDALDSQNCTQCKQGFYLLNNTCYSSCPPGTYAQISVKKCLSCQLFCQTCLNATHCTSCKSPNFLFTDNLCYSSCPNTTTPQYFSYNFKCVKCEPQCLSCTTNHTTCTVCSSNYYYQNQDTRQCSTSCQANYFAKGNMCVKCLTPCLTCDSTYYSCKTCDSNSTFKYLYSGNCLDKCPLGYYPDTLVVLNQTIFNVCKTCVFPCATCSNVQCITCQSFAYMYKSTCVLNCQTTIDMPYQKDKYCTNCLSIPFCTICEKTQTASFQCWSCTYPYVLFQNQCLNHCPRNYAIKSQTDRECIYSEAYLKQREQIYKKNKPILPFIYLVIFLGMIIFIYPIAKLVYQYTYHIGYLIFLVNLLCYVLIYNWLTNYDAQYSGQYYDGSQRDVPLTLIIFGLILNICILGWLGFTYVIKQIYLTDARYQEWKNKYFYNFVALVFSYLVLGHKSHKIYYSKLFGLSIFSFRIVSVQKFQLQDRITLLSCFADLFFIMSFIVVAYNVYIQYSVIYLTSFQFLALKLIEWLLLALDSKKPDRGFFYGDQKVAQQQIIKQEEEQQINKLRRVDTDHLIKMIRQKSAGNLRYNKQPFGQIDKIQFLSVYDPNDYDQVPKIPLKRISRNIEKGKFRKGRKITIQQKLQRFADTIKPKPKVVKKQEYLNALIYWKPPKKVKIKQSRIQPLSQQSMLKILEGKQDEYREQLHQIETVLFDQKPTQPHNFRTGQFFYKNTNALNIDSYDDLQNSNPSIQQFQDISSQIYRPGQQIQYNDLLNLNYAKKKHLPKNQKKPHFDSNQMRILYHQPMKKRQSRLQVHQFEQKQQYM